MSELEKNFPIFRARRPRLRTVSRVMHLPDRTASRQLDRSSTVTALLDRSIRLLESGPADTADVLHDLDSVLYAATTLGAQLRLALGFTVSEADRHDLAVGAFVEATSFDTASPEAIGAIISVVEAVVRNDVDAVTEVALDALDSVDPFDLFEGAAAVSASITLAISDRIAVDPVRVVAELRIGFEQPEVDQDGRVQACGAAGLAGRPARQTWSGRNSQCHGSRGTASTQPNRGPFTFIH